MNAIIEVYFSLISFRIMLMRPKGRVGAVLLLFMNAALFSPSA